MSKDLFIDIDQIKARINAQRRPILHVGLTGGIASGKSTVAEMLKNYGAAIIDFDILARKVVEPGTQGLSDIIACFGCEILDKDGFLDRKSLSKIVFKDQHKRRELEKLIHPAIFQSFCQEVKNIGDNEQSSVIIAVIPLLIEMNLQKLFHKLIVVHVSSSIQLERLMNREKIGSLQASDMIKSQLAIDEKIKHANFLVDNSEDLENTARQVRKIGEILQNLSVSCSEKIQD